jgi:hypothetical protein
MNSNGNGHHEHFHERKAPGAVQDAAFEPLLDSSEAAALLKIHPKTLEAGPQWRDRGNSDRQALAIPCVGLERMAGKNRKLNIFSCTGE